MTDEKLKRESKRKNGCLSFIYIVICISIKISKYMILKTAEEWDGEIQRTHTHTHINRKEEAENITTTLLIKWN
jgi:hypothetical protein